MLWESLIFSYMRFGMSELSCTLVTFTAKDNKKIVFILPKMLEKSAIQQDSLQNHSERNDTQGRKLCFKSQTHSFRVLGDLVPLTVRMSSLPHGHREFVNYVYWSAFTKSPKIIYCSALAPDNIPSITHHIRPNVFAFRARCKAHLFIQVYASRMNAKPWLLLCLYKGGRVWIYKLPYEFTPCWLLPLCVLLHAVEEATSYKGPLSVPPQCPQGVLVHSHFT